MMGTTHVAFAVLCYYIIAYFAKLPFEAPMVLTLLIIGSLIPDIDHPRAFLNQQFYLFKRASGSFGGLVTHRGIVHSFLAAVIATAVVGIIAIFYQLEMLAVMCFFLGFVSHLVADTLNPAGIKWLQPFSKAKVKDGIRTGSAIEKIFLLVTIVAVVAIVYEVHSEWFNIFWEQGLLLV